MSVAMHYLPSLRELAEAKGDTGLLQFYLFIVKHGNHVIRRKTQVPGSWGWHQICRELPELSMPAIAPNNIGRRETKLLSQSHKHFVYSAFHWRERFFPGPMSS
jgi:hypothetical protein